MICLFQQYNQESKDLHESLKTIGNNCPVIVINNDGFLPDDVHSPFKHYIMQQGDNGKPLYYNQLKVPEYWEIDGNQHEAKVMDCGILRAVIRYATPKHLRLIQSVEWLDRQGRVRSIDRYNQFGWRFAQTIFQTDNQPITTTYYTKDNREILVENYQTGTLTLNDKHLVRIFANRIAFIEFYLTQEQFNLSRIIYNSLAEPFLLAYQLNIPGNDILVWQEHIENDIPGNMTLLLQDNIVRPTKILVQNKPVYNRLNELLPVEQQDKCHFIGNIYPIKYKNHFNHTILIYTNSDQIEHIETLVQSLPMYHFKIAALTEMSSHLMALQSYHNVQLFPNVTMARVKQLNDTCNIYLDINHYDEILSAVRTAFEHHMLLMAFSNTLHHRNYIHEPLIFDTNNVDAMIAILKQISERKDMFDDLLSKQYFDSDHQEKIEYAQIWENWV